MFTFLHSSSNKTSKTSVWVDSPLALSRDFCFEKEVFLCRILLVNYLGWRRMR
jgi:hypothetical protein